METSFSSLWNYPAHAICLLYDWRILAPDIAFNLGIAFSYFCIPMALYRLVSTFRRTFMPFRSVIWMFVVFIMACGMSHVSRVLTILYGGGFYLLDIAICGTTCIASLIATVILICNGEQLLTLVRNLLITEEK